MKSNKLPLIPFALALIFTVTSCKTTVDNYRNAYQTAIEKKKAEAVDDMLPAGAVLQDIDGPQLTVIDGDSVFFETKHLLFADTVTVKPYNIVVGRYSMETNARSHRDRISKDFSFAELARDADSHIYVVAASYTEKERAMQEAIKMKKMKGIFYSGIERTPLIIEMPFSKMRNN